MKLRTNNSFIHSQNEADKETGVTIVDSTNVLLFDYYLRPLTIACNRHQISDEVFARFMELYQLQKERI